MIGNFLDNINSPVREIKILAGGSGYANGETLTFSAGVGTVSNASAKIMTTNSGAIDAIAITNSGSYNVVPTVTINTSAGFGAQLEVVLDNDNFYMFVGRSLPYPDETNPDPNYENDFDGGAFHHEQMYFGVKLQETNFSYMVPKYQWTAGTVYSQYDDKDTDLPGSEFYVINSSNNVFKCIDNAGGAKSTVEPTSTVFGGLPTETADGYRWLFMYGLSGQDMTKFSTGSFIPVKVDANVQSAAIDGGIMNIKVVSGGSQYPFNSGTLGNISDRTIAIAANASSQQNYYANCTLTVFGQGNLITNLKIANSFLQGNTVYITTANSFNANQATQGFQYQIAPSLKVTGTGDGCEGYFEVNPSSGSIESVVIFKSGSGYVQATANAVSGVAFGSGAVLRPIISPPGGHGSSIYSELYSQWMGVTGSFSNTYGFAENVTIRTVGVLRNPTVYNSNGTPFSNTTFNQLTTLNVANTTAQAFSLGEKIIGNISGAAGAVAFCNTTVTLISGLTGTFIDGEILTGQTSLVQYTLANVASTPDLATYSGEILYAQNVLASPRSASTSEQIKLVLKQ